MQWHAIFKAADVVIGILIETRDVPDEGSWQQWATGPWAGHPLIAQSPV